MKYLIIILSIFIISSTANAKDKWDKIDKTLFISYVTSTTIDCMQTSYIFNNDNYNETNLHLRYGVDRIGNIFIPLYFGTEICAVYFFSNQLPSRYRKLALSIMLGSSLLYINNNHTKGIGFSISF